jgi:hypothetical protein
VVAQLFPIKSSTNEKSKPEVTEAIEHDAAARNKKKN